MKNNSQIKLINDIISLYETNPEKIKSTLYYIVDGFMEYYSINISIENLINELKENKFQLEHLTNVLNNHADTIYNLLIALNVKLYYSSDINNNIIIISENYTFHKIDKNINISDIELHFLADMEISMFNKLINDKYGLDIEIVRAGTNNRHIGIVLDRYTEDNIIKIYEILDDLIIDYNIAEKQFIDKVNNIK